jgi:hypothetical protein
MSDISRRNYTNRRVRTGKNEHGSECNADNLELDIPGSVSASDVERIIAHNGALLRGAGGRVREVEVLR